MKVVVAAHQKGGVGKTTLSGHLAVMATIAGHGPVALIDTDKQGSLSSWWNDREAPEPLFASVEIASLAAHLKALAKSGVKLAVIDTPPAVTEIIEAVIKLADLVIIPTRPSPHDLRAIGPTVEMVERHGRPMVFVINGAASRATITGDTAVALSQYGKVAPVTIYQRTEFATSMIDGRTVMEINENGKSADEIKRLWEYLAAQLGKI